MFNRSICLYDLELTGVETTQHEIIQISAILLDPKTLTELRSFNSYVRPSHPETADPVAMSINQLNLETLNTAPDLEKVLTNFEQFAGDSMLATYGGDVDRLFLSAAYHQLGKNYPFDYHTFNLWNVFYFYLASVGGLNTTTRFSGFRLDDFARSLNIPIPENRHDALADCRLAADVFRVLWQKFTT